MALILPAVVGTDLYIDEFSEKGRQNKLCSRGKKGGLAFKNRRPLSHAICPEGRRGLGGVVGGKRPNLSRGISRNWDGFVLQHAILSLSA